MANKYKLEFSLSDGTTIEAGEIVVPEGKKGVDGHTPIKGEDYYTEADKAAFVQDVLAALPYYDGSVTISGGVELISFTIDGDHYEAVDGMTWAEWVDSEYNTGGYKTGDNSYPSQIYSTSAYYVYNDGYVTTDDIIAQGTAYTTKYLNHSGGGGQ